MKTVQKIRQIGTKLRHAAMQLDTDEVAALIEKREKIVATVTQADEELIAALRDELALDAQIESSLEKQKSRLFTQNRQQTRARVGYLQRR